MGLNSKLKLFVSEIMFIELLLILYMRGKQSVMISPYISILNLNNWKHLKGENFNLYTFTIPIRKSAKTAFWSVFFCGILAALSSSFLDDLRANYVYFNYLGFLN